MFGLEANGERDDNKHILYLLNNYNVLVVYRKELTDEWKRCGLEEGVEFATLTDIIYKAWSDHTAKKYKRLKNLKKENLRDNMTNRELVLNMLAELTTKGVSENIDPKNMQEHTGVAIKGATVARNVRIEMELVIGQKVVTSLNAKNIYNSIDVCPEDNSKED